MVTVSSSSILNILVSSIFLINLTDCLRFYVPSNGRKCVQDEVNKNVLVTGLYEVQKIAGNTMNIDVTDTKRHVLFQRDNIDKGKFAFTTEDYEAFEICFHSKSDAGNAVGEIEASIDLFHGAKTQTDYSELAKAENLKPIELQLKVLEDLSTSIVKDFIDLHDRQNLLRDTNESTRGRLIFFSFFSMAVLVCLAVWQVTYLRRYFKSKKLIE